MKRQVLAVAVGSLIALPAFADFETGLEVNEIQPGMPYSSVLSGKTRNDVRNELIAAQRSGNVIVNAELGTMAKQGTSVASGKSRDEVRTELAQAQRSGNFITNAELGTTANQL
jgi:hypothetical protein